MKIKNIEVRTGDTVIVEFLPPFNYYSGVPMTVDTENGRLTVRDDVWVNITMVPESLVKSVKVVAPINPLYLEPADNFEHNMVKAMQKIALTVGKKFGVDCGYDDLPDLVSDYINNVHIDYAKSFVDMQRKIRKLKEKVNCNYQAKQVAPVAVGLDFSKLSVVIKHPEIGNTDYVKQQNCIDAAVEYVKDGDEKYLSLYNSLLKLEEENQNLKNALKNINIISGNHKVCGKPPFKP